MTTLAPATVQRPGRAALVASVLLAALAVTVALLVHVPAFAAQHPASPRMAPAYAGSGMTYHVSPEGNDAADGRSAATAWRSLSRASSATLAPGDRLLLRRGGTWTGTLTIRSSGTAGSPVVVGAYGQGGAPVVRGGDGVRVLGSHVVVSGLESRASSWAGFQVVGQQVVVEHSTATDNITGVHVSEGARGARVRHNAVVDNKRMSVNDSKHPDDDSGAFGVLVNGDDAVVAWNVISGHHAPSADYGVDGAAVEVYQARGTRVHHNIARDNHTFIELGGTRAADTVIAYNQVTSSLSPSLFLVTRGATSGFGPVLGTVAEHNTVRMTGARSEGFVCYGGCSPDLLALRRNIITAQLKVGYSDGPLGGGQNVWWGGQRQFAMLPGDVVSAPLLRPAASGVIGLRAASPAVDRAPGGRWARDVRGRALPERGTAKRDAGAYER